MKTLPPPEKRSLHISLAVVTLYFITVPVAHATVVVNWVADAWVTSSQDLQGKNTVFETVLDLDGDTAADDSRGGRAFSATIALSPTSGYTTTLDSAIFYGGAVMGDLNDPTADGFTDYSIGDQGPNDSIHVHLQGKAGHEHNFQSVQYWDQADFLNGGDSATVALDATSSLTLGLHNVSGKLKDADGEGRWVIRNGSQFYISETTFSPDNATFNLNNFGGAGDNWAVYTPSGLDIDFDDGAATFSSTSSDFSDISGLGFYIAHDAYYNDNLTYHVHGFTVNAAAPGASPIAAVPESSSTALLGLGGLALAMRRKRRRLHTA